MDDLFAKLQDILGSEDGRKQLQSVAEAMGLDKKAKLPDLSDLNSMFGNGASADQKDGESKDADPSDSGEFDFSNFDLSGLDLNMLMNIQSMLGSIQKDDENTLLLKALKPHFSEERKAKIDQAIKIMRLLSMWPMIKDSGILGGLFGDGSK